MKQELIEIVKQGQIDPETAGRLAECMDSEFKSSRFDTLVQGK